MYLWLIGIFIDFVIFVLLSVIPFEILECSFVLIGMIMPILKSMHIVVVWKCFLIHILFGLQISKSFKDASIRFVNFHLFLITVYKIKASNLFNGLICSNINRQHKYQSVHNLGDHWENSKRYKEHKNKSCHIKMSFSSLILLSYKEKVKKGREDKRYGIGCNGSNNTEHIFDIFNYCCDNNWKKKYDGSVNIEVNFSQSFSLFFVFCLNIWANLLHIIITNLPVLCSVFIYHQNNIFGNCNEIIPGTKKHDWVWKEYW